MSFKRTMILNSAGKDNKKGVLILSNLNEQCSGEIKLYNFEEVECNALALGIHAGREVIKVPLEFKDGSSNFKTQKFVNLNEKLTCALVNLKNVRYPEIILGGSSNFGGSFGEVEAAFAPAQVEREKLYEPEEDNVEELIDKELDEELSCDNCAGCPYKEAFYDEPAKIINNPDENINKKLEEISDKDVIDFMLPNKKPYKENLEDYLEEVCFKNIKSQSSDDKDSFKSTDNLLNNDNANFYEQIKPQIDKLFNEYAKETRLEELIPGSHWAKINYEKDDNFYVLGLIYEGANIRYIAYGLPADDDSTPPKDLQEYAQWLPLENDGKGYWIVYQDAGSGESVLMDII